MEVGNWTGDERPRERLLSHGAAVLSNSELLALLASHRRGRPQRA